MLILVTNFTFRALSRQRTHPAMATEMGRLLTVSLCVALFGLLVARGSGEVVHVDPMAVSCSDFNCTRNATSLLRQNYTLDGALASVASRMTIVLSSGCHCVQNYSLVQSVTDVTLKGEGEVTVSCAPGLGLAFYNLLNFTIENLTIDGCGLTGSYLSGFEHTLKGVLRMFFQVRPYYHIALLCGNCTDIHLKRIAIKNTLGLGFLGVNIMGTSEILNSNFSFNAPTSDLLPFTSLQSDMVGGGVLFLYHDYQDANTYSHDAVNLSVRESSFSYNTYLGLATTIGLNYQYSEDVRNIGYILGGGGGLTLILAQANYSVSTTVDECVFRHNKARYGGGVQVTMFSHVMDSNITLSNCVFEDNGKETERTANILNSTHGGGLAFFCDFVRPFNHTGVDQTRDSSVNFIVSQTTFRRNQAYIGGAVMIESLYFPVDGIIPDFVLFRSCVFEDNFAFLGSAMYLMEAKRSGAQLGLYFVLDNTTMSGNSVYPYDSTEIQSIDVADSSSVIDATSVNVTLQNSSFTGNIGSVVRTVETILHLAGTVVFANNTGTFGGALRLLAVSFLIIRNHSDITFRNNIAEVAGGAIYVYYLNSLPNIAYFDCFLFFDKLEPFCFNDIDCVNISDTGSKVRFVGNSAKVGSIVYGSTLEKCPWGEVVRSSGNFTNMSLFEILYQHYSHILSFDKAPVTIDQVTTLPGRIELRDKPSDPINVIPGEVFHVNVVVLDRFFRETPAVISSKAEDYLQQRSVTSVLGFSGYWFTGSSSTVQMAIYGTTNQENITVSLFTTDSFAQTSFKVNLLDCPMGFILREHSCVCDPRLHGHPHIRCNSTTKELTVDNGVWVGIGTHGQLARAQCINDYCEPGPINFRPPDFDIQCRSGYHRTGLVCAACTEGYSAVFGSSKCKKCGNIGLLLIPFIAVLGILLVFVLCFFHFTISHGAPLSIIFYTNILTIYSPSFTAGSSRNRNYFPQGQWLFLDFGTEWCFYNGMDAISRTALSFAFPLYLYFLIFMIVLLARRSDRFSRLFYKHSSSPANLFATLLLLTHASLTEACIEVLGFTRITTLPHKDNIYWGVDPNEPYLSPFHSTLVAVSIPLMVFYILPAPFFLIFPTCSCRLGRFQRLMPIFDAFWAPFKPRYRFWVGLRLLLRALPLFFAYFFNYPTNVAFLGLFLIALIYVQTLLSPFKSLLVNVLDLFFQFVLLTMVILTLYFSYFINHADGKDIRKYANDQYLAAAIVALAGTLAIIIAFIVHLFVRFPRLRVLLRSLLQKLKCRQDVKPRPISISKVSPSQTYGTVHSDQTVQSDNSTKVEDAENGIEKGNGLKRIKFSELREPLLDEGELIIEDTSLTSQPSK